MPGALQTLLAKLKRRRKSKAAAPNLVRNAAIDERPGKKGLTITDRIANLVVSDSSLTTSSPKSEPPKVITFGTSPDIDFTFILESGAIWPGPPYDKMSMFAPGVFDKARPVRPKAKQKSSKRKLSSEGGQLTLRPKEVPSTKIVRDISPNQKSPRPLHCYGSAPARDPPQNLLNLPGEIRNQIYRLLCVRSEPIVAQFRPIIKPKCRKGNRAKPFEATKRFPREPTLALVCRQVMGEVLSIFYSDNTFIFRRSEDERFKDLIMTNSRMMKKWTPQNNLAASLSSIEVHFTIHPSPSAKETIVYSFRRFMDGRLQVSSNESTTAVDSCTCFDRKLMTALKERLEMEEAGHNLLTVATKVPLWRTGMLVCDTSLVLSGTTLYRSKKLTCEDCGLITLKALETGL